MTRIIILSIFLFTGITSPALPQEYSGVPRIIDGNTLIIDFNRIRLHGIEAPNAEQLCQIKGKNWRCGWEATNALARIIGRHWVTCKEIGFNRGDIVDATCLAGDILDINAWMVRNGWATARNRTDGRLQKLEALARQDQIGIWRIKYKNNEHLRSSNFESNLMLR